jgi:hypothetical protein
MQPFLASCVVVLVLVLEVLGRNHPTRLHCSFFIARTGARGADKSAVQRVRVLCLVSVWHRSRWNNELSGAWFLEAERSSSSTRVQTPLHTRVACR